APNEVMVELDEGPIAEIVGSQIVVGDIVGVKAASQRCHGFVALGGEPLPVRLHVVTDVDRRKGGGNPAGFETAGRVGSRADLPDPEFLTGLDDRVTNA